MSKFTFTEPISIHVFLVLPLSTQRSSIRIDIFVFGSTLNSNKFDETVKIVQISTPRY